MRTLTAALSGLFLAGAVFAQTAQYGDPDFGWHTTYRYGFPVKLTLDETGDVPYDFNGDLELPFTLSHEATVWLAVYTEGANPPATDGGGPGGAVVRAAGIDELVYVSAGVDKAAGAGTITWDGTDYNGDKVAAGTYRYYLFAIDQSTTPTIVGGGNSPWAQATRFDPTDDPNAPMVYWTYHATDIEGGSNAHTIRRAPMGTDYSVFYPVEEGAEKQIPYETFGIPWVNEMTGADADGGWNDMGSLEIDPADNSVIYVIKYRNTPSVGVFKAIIDEEAGTINPDPDWPVADPGRFVPFDERMPGSALRAEQHHPWASDDGLIWVSHRPNGWPVQPAVYSLDRATGEIMDMIDYTEYYTTPWVDADGADQMKVSGPWGLDVDDTGIYTSGLDAHQFWDNVAEGDFFNLQSFPMKRGFDGSLIWQNRNGDGFIERLYGPEAEAAGGDPNGFDQLTNSEVAATSWGISVWGGYNTPIEGRVLGPDGSGLFKVDIPGVPPGTNPGYVRWINHGSAWDGYYTQYGGQITANHTPADLITGLIGDQFTAVAEVGAGATPASSSLGDAYPNPANPDVTIPFEIGGLGEDVTVRIAVYNTTGQEVAELVNEPLSSAIYEATWDGLDANGYPVASGVYVYELTAGGFVDSKRLTLVK